MSDNETLGAYGLQLPGLPGSHWLSHTEPDWPVWDVRSGGADPHPGDDDHIAADTARLSLAPAGALEMNRHQRVATVHVEPPPPQAAWVHPYLAPLAIVANNWLERLVFHAGCFVASDGTAWAVLGDRERGKSTTLAGLAARGVSIIADDLVVTDGRRAFTGPRCLDLREQTAQHYGLGTDLGVVGTRPRWRVDLPRVAPSFPLGGFFVLAWGENVGVERLELTQRFPVLHQACALTAGQTHGRPWLHAAALTTYRVTRPRTWAQVDAALDVILAASMPKHV